jgi:phage tail-like protein
MQITGTPRSFFHRYAFNAEIPGIGSAAFSSVGEISVEAAIVSHSEGGALVPYKAPGRLTFSDVQLERGATRDRDLYDWFLEVANAAAGRGLVNFRYKRSVDIVQLDRDGSTLRRWTLFNAWPSKFVAGEWDNDSDEVLIESVTLTYDYFTLAR